MDLQAAETAHQREAKEVKTPKTAWVCPCNGCKKAAKQERQRILKIITDFNQTNPGGPAIANLIEILSQEDKKK